MTNLWKPLLVPFELSDVNLPDCTPCTRRAFVSRLANYVTGPVKLFYTIFKALVPSDSYYMLRFCVADVFHSFLGVFVARFYHLRLMCTECVVYALDHRREFHTRRNPHHIAPPLGFHVQNYINDSTCGYLRL